MRKRERKTDRQEGGHVEVRDVTKESALFFFCVDSWNQLFYMYFACFLRGLFLSGQGFPVQPWLFRNCVDRTGLKLSDPPASAC